MEIQRSEVISYSQNTATEVFQNGDYAGTTLRNTTINQGDVIQMQLVTIDTQIAEDDNIVLSQDTQLQILFSYYDIDYSIDKKYQMNTSTPWAAPTFDYYTAYSTRDIVQLNSQNFKCLQWSPGEPDPYQPFQFVGVTVTYNYINPQGIQESAQYQGSAIGTDTATVLPGDTTVRFMKGTLQVGLIQSTLFTPSGKVPGDPTKVIPEGQSTSPVSAGKNSLELNTMVVVIPSGRYTPESLAKFITDKLSNSYGVTTATKPGGSQIFGPANPFLLRTDDLAAGNLIFTRAINQATQGVTLDFNTTNSYSYGVPGSPPAIFIGASQMAIQYGLDGGVYQQSYMHTPLYGGSTNDGKEVIAYYRTTTAGIESYNLVNAATGIAIHDLQPVSFWSNILGLYDRLVVPLYTDTNDIQYYQRGDLIQRITYGFSSMQSFFPTYNRDIVDPPVNNPEYVDVTGVTQAIVGEPPRTNDGAGYYLVKLLTLPVGSYNSGTEYSSTVIGIVSLQYNSNNVVTGFSDSGIPYQHWGPPLTMGSFRVQIVDPSTDDVVSTLGPNNTLILKITKAFNIPVAPPAPPLNHLKPRKTRKKVNA